MASPTLTLYNENSGSTVYGLQQTGPSKTRWLVSGRSLAKPQFFEVERKFAPQNSGANDHVIIRCGVTEQSTLSPYKPCTFMASLDLSIPRDQTGCTAVIIMKAISNLVCALNSGTTLYASNASNAGYASLLSGGDL